MHPTLLDHLAWLEGNVCLMKWRANDRWKRCPEKKLHLPVRPKRRLVLCRKPTLCQFQRLCLLRRQIVHLCLFRPAAPRSSLSPPAPQARPPPWNTSLRIPRGRQLQLPLRRFSWARDLLRPIDFLHEEAHRVAYDVFLLGWRVESRRRHSLIGRPQPHVALPVALFLAPFDLDGLRRGAKD